MEQSKPIPEEIQKWINEIEKKEMFGEPLLSANWGYRRGSTAMYHRMAEEIEALKKERDMYRKGLEDIIERFPWSWQAQFAKAALAQYSSPKSTNNE